jgi:hypothetical protein
MEGQVEKKYRYPLSVLVRAIVYGSAVSGVNGAEVQFALYDYGCDLIQRYNHNCVSADTDKLTAFTQNNSAYEALAALIVGGHEIIRTFSEHQLRETLAQGIAQRIEQLKGVSPEDLLFDQNDRIKGIKSSISDLSDFVGYLKQTTEPSVFTHPERM